MQSIQPVLAQRGGGDYFADGGKVRGMVRERHSREVRFSTAFVLLV
jgi:hypothetical protein